MPKRRYELWVRRSGQLVPVDSQDAVINGFRTFASNDETIEVDSQWSDIDDAGPTDLLCRQNPLSSDSSDSDSSSDPTNTREVAEVCLHTESLKLIIWLLDSASCRVKVSFIDISLVVSVFVLFSYELQILFIPIGADAAFLVVLLACALFLSCEFLLNLTAHGLLNSIAKAEFLATHSWPNWEGYYAFCFWCADVGVILSLALQISLISSEPIVRCAEAVRMVRCFRLLYAYWATYGKQSSEQKNTSVDGEADAVVSRTNRSVIGSELKSSTTTRLVLLVLLLLLALPYLLAPPVTSNLCAFSTQFLQAANTDPSLSAEVRLEFLSVMTDMFSSTDNVASTGPVLLQLISQPLVNGSVVGGTRDEVRSIDQETCTSFVVDSSSGIKYLVSLTLSWRSWARADAFLVILMLSAVVALLFTAHAVFAGDIDKWVAEPLEVSALDRKLSFISYQ